MRKKCLENFIQAFRLCMALILIQHDQKISKPAKKQKDCMYVFLRFQGSAYPG